MSPLNGILSAALLNALSWISLGFSLSGGVRAKAPKCLIFHTRLLVSFKRNRYNKESNVNLCSSSVGETKKLVEKISRNISALQSQATLRQVRHICLLASVQTRIQKISLFLTPDMSIWQEENPWKFWQFTKTQTGLDYKLEALITAESVVLFLLFFFAIGIAENEEADMQLGEVKAKTSFSSRAEKNLWCKYLYMRLREILGHPSILSKNILFWKATSQQYLSLTTCWCQIFPLFTSIQQRAASYLLIVNLFSPHPPFILSTETPTIFSTECQCTSRLFYAWKQCLWKIWMHNPGDPHPLQYSKGKKDTSWIAALSAFLLWLTSFTELEGTPTGVKESFILYSQVVALTAKIAI